MNFVNIKQSYLVDGAISSEWIADLIREHQSEIAAGAHSMFLGQVRADTRATGGISGNSGTVRRIYYSAYNKMAETEFNKIEDEAFKKFTLTKLHILHSLGSVNTGEISLLVIASSAHRKDSQDSIKYIVDEIKKRVPIWKKEVLNDGTHIWI